MTNKQYYFGFRGKIQRVDFFVSGIILPSLLVCVALLIVNTIEVSRLIQWILIGIFSIFSLWINMAVSIKRIKDLKMSLWLYPLTMVPYIGFIPFLILVFKKGK